ncbi:LysE family translocator [Prauserella cavernicola]|uniref:LysE family translocator n=1 Tax=Prauserella cavernicola TaxID=2800127 RepID=A0A934QPX8_9PSEU|nr:LysE family translocator [Prauserella cavernicola]MBK1784022.1 LysE family translocator [Prauserella cavernicola]
MTWLLVFFGAALFIALTPGANNLLGLHHGMRHGLAKALAGLGGRLAAFSLMVAAVAIGLGQVLAASEVALTVIKWIGVAYLVWLGGSLLVSTFRHGGRPSLPTDAGEPLPVWPLVRKEFLVAITNPKAVLVFTAFVPQFVDNTHGPVSWQVTLLGICYLLAEFLAGTVYVGVGAVARAAALSARARRNVDRGTGIVLLGMAGALATSVR